jgi:hypothetical protein
MNEIAMKVFSYLVAAIILFGGGYAYCYYKTVPELKSQIVSLSEIVKGYQDRNTLTTTVTGEAKDNIAYVAKTDASDADVELNEDKVDVKVKVNGDTVTMPSKVDETHKFENGKLVIERKQDYNFDMSEMYNKAVSNAVSAKSRVGKLDPGAIYVKDSGMYGGVRYNLKMADIGAYGNAKGGYAIAIHGKF